jgi:hypothetical protein
MAPVGFHCASAVYLGLCSTYWVWRLRLRLPTPGLVGTSHIHSSCLAPVSFAGFLTNASASIATWAFAQVLPNAALRGRFRAVWAIFARGVLDLLCSLLCSVRFSCLPPSSGTTWLYLAVWTISSSCGVLAPVLSPLLFPVLCLPPSSGST